MALSPVLQAIGKAQSLARPLARDAKGHFVRASTVMNEAKRIMAATDLNLWVSDLGVHSTDNPESATIRRSYCIQHAPTGDQFVYEQEWPINPRWRVSGTLTSATKRALIDVFLLTPDDAPFVAELDPRTVWFYRCPGCGRTVTDGWHSCTTDVGTFTIQIGQGPDSNPSPKPESVPAPSKPDQDPVSVSALSCALCACSLEREPGRGRKVGSVTLKTRGQLDDGRVVCAVCYFLESPKGRRLAAQCGFSEKELLDQRDAAVSGRAPGSRPCLYCKGKVERDSYWVLLSRPVTSEHLPPFPGVVARHGLYRCSINDNGARSVLVDGGSFGIKPDECFDVCGSCAEPEWFRAAEYDVPGGPAQFLEIMNLRFPVGASVRHRSAVELGVGVVALKEEEEDAGDCVGYPLVKWSGGGSGFYHPRALVNVQDETLRPGAIGSKVHLLTENFHVDQPRLRGRCGERESGIDEAPVHHMSTKLGSVNCDECKRLAGGASPPAPAETVPPFGEVAPVTPGTPTGDVRPNDVTTGATAGASPPGSAPGIMTGARELPPPEVAPQTPAAVAHLPCSHRKCDGSGKLASGEVCLCARGVAPMTKTPAATKLPVIRFLTVEELVSRLGSGFGSPGHLASVTKWVHDLCGFHVHLEGVFSHTTSLLSAASSLHGRDVVDEAWKSIGGEFQTKKGARVWKTHFTTRAEVCSLIRALPSVKSARDRQAGDS